MRAAILAAVVLASSTIAHAQAQAPKPTGVFRHRILTPSTEPGTAHAAISKTLYLNSCRPNGCTVMPGDDDSRTNHSSIPDAQVHLDAWPHGEAHWQDLVQCVKETFQPFELQIVTADPGPGTNHFEVMIGGTDTQLHPELAAGGVAPFIGCGGGRDNVISFVFGSQNSDLEFLCGAVAQEAAHVWGLDHELHPLDPMTYLDLGSLKRFQNEFAPCGEEAGQPRECQCGNSSTQNSYDYLSRLFGGANLPPPQIAISTPTDGQWVKPGFPIRATLTSLLQATKATLMIDGAETATVNSGPFVFNAPAALNGGRHTITVSGTDSGGRTASTTVTINLTKKCGADAACDANQACIGGLCIPTDVAGGLGAPCVTDSSCITGRCVDGSGDLRCTAACDAGRVCPDGYQCVDDGTDVGLCWPAEPVTESGCASSTSSSGGFVLGGLALLVLARRRRTR